MNAEKNVSDNSYRHTMVKDCLDLCYRIAFSKGFLPQLEIKKRLFEINLSLLHYLSCMFLNATLGTLGFVK